MSVQYQMSGYHNNQSSLRHDIEEIPERNERGARVTMMVCVVYDIRPYVQWRYLYWVGREGWRVVWGGTH